MKKIKSIIRAGICTKCTSSRNFWVTQLEASFPWHAHICMCKKAVHSAASCAAGPGVVVDGGPQSSGWEVRVTDAKTELRLRPQSVAWDPNKMQGYRRGGQGFELLGHAGIHFLCQESEAALMCEKRWGASCLPVSQTHMYFSPRQEFCLWTSCAYLFHKTLFSFCLWCSGFNFSLNFNFFPSLNHSIVHLKLSTWQLLVSKSFPCSPPLELVWFNSFTANKCHLVGFFCLI